MIEEWSAVDGQCVGAHEGVLHDDVADTFGGQLIKKGAPLRGDSLVQRRIQFGITREQPVDVESDDAADQVAVDLPEYRSQIGRGAPAQVPARLSSGA